MAEVEDDGERAIFEDEDDIAVDIDSDEEDEPWNFDDEDSQGENLYDSPLDNVDEVLYFCDKMQNL